MISTGDRVPGATLFEFVDVASEGCSLGPNAVDVSASLEGRTVASG